MVKLKPTILCLLLLSATQLNAGLYAVRVNSATSNISFYWNEMYLKTAIPFAIDTIEVMIDTVSTKDGNPRRQMCSITPSTPFNEFLASRISHTMLSGVEFPVKAKIEVVPLEEMQQQTPFQVVPWHIAVLSGNATNSKATAQERYPALEEFVAVEREPYFDYQALSSSIVYPDKARAAGIEGRVDVAALVGKHGFVEIALVTKSDNKLLDASALKAVANLAFSPAIQKGEPIRTWVVIPVAYKLR